MRKRGNEGFPCREKDMLFKGLSLPASPTLKPPSSPNSMEKAIECHTHTEHATASPTRSLHTEQDTCGSRISQHRRRSHTKYGKLAA